MGLTAHSGITGINDSKRQTSIWKQILDKFGSVSIDKVGERLMIKRQRDTKRKQVILKTPWNIHIQMSGTK